jgi:hypothetical protein
MYLLITHWPNQNTILFLCGHRRRSNHVAPTSLPRHTLKLSLLLLTTLLLLLLTRCSSSSSTRCSATSSSACAHLNMASHLLLLEELP